MKVEVFRVGHLPGLDAGQLAWRELPAPQLPAGHGFEVAALTPDQLRTLCEQIRGPGRQGLRALPVRDIVQAIDRVIQQLLDPASPEHQLLLRWLPLSTGFSPEMIRVNLSPTLRTFRALQLQRLKRSHQNASSGKAAQVASRVLTTCSQAPILGSS